MMITDRVGLLQRLRRASRDPFAALAYRRDHLAALWFRATSRDHTTFYRRLMAYKARVRGPEHAVGGFDLGIGRLQYEFMVEQGLQSGHRLLDLGCGALRGGEYFIDHLGPGGYIGMDISSDLIEAGKSRLAPTTLEAKDPTFIVNDDLRFEEVPGDVDAVIAQSVLTHIPPEDVQELFAHLPNILARGGAFFATYFEETDFGGQRRLHPNNFRYSGDELLAWASQAQLRGRVLPTGSYPHPRGQRMIVLGDDTIPERLAPPVRTSQIQARHGTPAASTAQ